jgi:hypothetical protein
MFEGFLEVATGTFIYVACYTFGHPKIIYRFHKMDKENQLKLTEEIIETAYHLLIRKLANGGLTARNENAFQLEFGHILKTLGQLYEFRLADKFHLEFETYIILTEQSIKSKSDRARVNKIPR